MQCTFYFLANILETFGIFGFIVKINLRMIELIYVGKLDVTKSLFFSYCPEKHKDLCDKLAPSALITHLRYFFEQGETKPPIHSTLSPLLSRRTR